MKKYANIIKMIRKIWGHKKSIIIFEFLFMTLKKTRHLVYYILLFGQIFSMLQSGSSLRVIIFWLIIAILFSLFTELYQDWYISIYRPKAMLELNSELFDKIYQKAATVDLECYETGDFYNNYTASINEAGNRIDKLISVLSSLISGILLLIIYTGLIWTRDKFALCLSIIPFISVFVFGNKINKFYYMRYQDNIEPNRIKEYVNRTVYLKDYSNEYRVSNIFNVLKKYFNDSVLKIIENTKKYGKKIALLQILNHFFGNSFMLLSAVFYGAYLMMVPKTLLIGDFYVLVSSIFNMLRTLLEVTNGFVELNGMNYYLKNLFQFLNYENKVYSAKTKNKPIKSFKEINFYDVSFSYPNSETVVLKKLNINIKRGQKIAIVGRNGSGKSTLIKLLLGFYQATNGKIVIDGNELDEVDLMEYQKLFGVCFQDSKVFSMSVYENVVMDDIENLDITESLEKAGIKEKIDYNGGITQNISREFDERGLILSGGEQQKLVLARLFVKDQDIVILDEPTSALDPLAEEDMFRRMLELCEDKTVIFISHRLSSAKMADKIYFLDDGSIIEKGKHSELIAKRGAYSKLFMNQAKGYQRGEECANYE